MRAGVRETLVHTGQHYDETMSEVFFRQLGIPEPAYNLEVGSDTHGAQTGAMLMGLERLVRELRPDRLLVYGDTNSTLAGALVAAKALVPVDHVEAGLRSFDRDMPEEVNRVVTDHLADMLFCPTRTAVANVEAEGIRRGVFLVGDVMLDLAIQLRSAAVQHPLPAYLCDGEYFLATIHRPSNTDDDDRLRAIMSALQNVARTVGPVVLPTHPRLARRVQEALVVTDGLKLINPIGYVEMQGLILRARGVITDSGGVQKEALFHGVRCVTLRDSTEWVESLEAGMNVLLGDQLDQLVAAAERCTGKHDVPSSVLAAFGGGRASDAIARAIGEAGAARRRWRQ